MRGRSFKRHSQAKHHVQHVVHANGQVTQHQEQTVSYKVHHSPAMQRKRLMLLVLLVAVSVAAVVGIRFYISNDLFKKPTPTTAPTVVSQLVDESLTQLATESPAGLSATVDKINATTGSDTQPTLVYIKLRYYLAVGDSVQARKTYDTLVKVYNPKAGYDPLINQSARSLESLKLDVEFLEKQATQLKKNAWGTTQ